jgi:hypothetical protein
MLFRRARPDELTVMMGSLLVASMSALLDPPDEALALGVDPREANVEVVYHACGQVFRMTLCCEGIAVEA